MERFLNWIKRKAVYTTVVLALFGCLGMCFCASADGLQRHQAGGADNLFTSVLLKSFARELSFIETFSVNCPSQRERSFLFLKSGDQEQKEEKLKAAVAGTAVKSVGSKGNSNSKVLKNDSMVSNGELVNKKTHQKTEQKLGQKADVEKAKTARMSGFAVVSCFGKPLRVLRAAYKDEQSLKAKYKVYYDVHGVSAVKIVKKKLDSSCYRIRVGRHGSFVRVVFDCFSRAKAVKPIFDGKERLILGYKSCTKAEDQRKSSEIGGK